MSIQLGDLCSLILNEHFGETVEKVGRDLFRGGQKPLKLICSSTGLGLNDVRQALCVLIKYDLVSFVPGKLPHIAEYKIQPDQIILILRYPKFLMFTKTLYGNDAEIIVEEILRHGSDLPSQIVLRSYKRIIALDSTRDKANLTIPSLRDTFEILVNKEYIKRCPLPVEKKAVPEFIEDLENEFKPPRIDIPKLVKAASGETVTFDDENIFYTINFDRFHQDLRDDLLVTAISRKISEKGGDVMRFALQYMHLKSNPWAPVSNAILASELKDFLKKSKADVELIKYLEDYLAVIAEDASKFLSRAEMTSVAYHINLQDAVRELTWCVLESGVDAKFGLSASRIFRLIREQQHIEQEKIQEKAMLADKEAKFLTYSLMQAGWIQQRELKKGVQKAGPTKTFYLFTIEISQVVRMYIEMCYKSLYNAIVRREHEKMENRCLLDKKQRIDAIALHMRKEGATDEQVAEIEEMVTPPELQLLEKIQLRVNKLSQAELQTDETLFILQLYLASNPEDS